MKYETKPTKQGYHLTHPYNATFEALMEQLGLTHGNAAKEVIRTAIIKNRSDIDMLWSILDSELKLLKATNYRLRTILIWLSIMYGILIISQIYVVIR